MKIEQVGEEGRETNSVQTRSFIFVVEMNFLNLENGYDATNLNVLFFLDTRCHGVFVLVLKTTQPATLPFNKFRPSL